MDPAEGQSRNRGERPPRSFDPSKMEVMFPLGGNCFIPASRVMDPATGARYRAARLLAGLSHQEVAERGNDAEVIARSEQLDQGPYRLTAEWVQKVEQDPGNVPIWVFEAVAHGIGKSPADIMEIELTSIERDSSGSKGTDV